MTEDEMVGWHHRLNGHDFCGKWGTDLGWLRGWREEGTLFLLPSGELREETQGTMFDEKSIKTGL